jgi:hypothetical protein
MHKTKAFLASAALSIILTGCTGNGESTPTPENFTKAINKHFLDHNECLLSNTRFPFETTDREQTKQMDSLVKASLLEKTVEPAIHVSRYTVSKEGERFAPRFCYGHRDVTAIDSFTPLAVNNGFKECTVNYHYALKEVPIWAKTPEVQAAFPDMAQATTSQSTAKILLAQTPTGWQVPD